MEKRTFLKQGCVLAAIALALFLFFKFVLSLILPFVIALAIAVALNPLVRILHQRTGLGKRFLSAATVSAVIVLLSFILFLLLSRLISELRDFAQAFAQKSDVYVESFFDMIGRIPFAKALGTDLTEAVSEALRGMLSSFTAKLPGFIAGVIGMLPHILLFSVIIVLASYYFCADLDKISAAVLSILPGEAEQRLKAFKARLKSTGLKYLKACAWLMIITYFELLVGFLILNIPYAFSLSLLVAAVDMLPILGVGIVLIPWAIWCKISGDTFTAIGLVLIFTTVTVMRRLIEPKIISNGIGLSPLTTLLSMYVGFRLFGLAGLFFAPLAAILILHALPEEAAKRLGLNAYDTKTEKKDKSRMGNKSFTK